MNKLILILSIVTALSCTDSKNEKNNVEKDTNNSDDVVFSDSLRALIVAKRQDSSFWDTEMLKTDLSSKNNTSTGPFTFGVFPVPRYDLIGKGTFAGLGNFGYSGAETYFKNIKDKTILYKGYEAHRYENVR